MQATLTVVGGKHQGREIPIKGPEFRIGRDDGCHLRPSSSEISRQHCALLFRDDLLFLKDCSGKPGTRVNGRLLLGGEFQLEHGDHIGVGPLTFSLALVTEAAVAPASETVADTSRPVHEDVENILAPEGGGRDAAADDTVLNAKPIAPTATTKPGKPEDSQAILCWE